MKKYRSLIISGVLLIVFIVYTILVSTVDVQAIGPNGSSVGFASFNGKYHNKIGTDLPLYDLIDKVSLLTVPVGGIFAVVGLVQWIKRKKLLEVDSNILALGIFYVLVFLSYLLFQIVVINYRPVLMNEALEASFPSSTTMLSLTLFITAIDQIFIYIEDKLLKWFLVLFDLCFCAFLVVGRILSGVHWMTDIIGGILLSSVLIFAYFGIKIFFRKKDTI